MRAKDEMIAELKTNRIVHVDDFLHACSTAIDSAAHALGFSTELSKRLLEKVGVGRDGTR